MKEGWGHDTGIAEGRSQRLEEGKDVWGSSTANQAGIEGLHACNKSTTPLCPFLDACQSGV